VLVLVAEDLEDTADTGLRWIERGLSRLSELMQEVTGDDTQ